MSDHTLSSPISAMMSKIHVDDSSQSSEAPSSRSLDNASDGPSNPDSENSHGPENLHDSQHLQESEKEVRNIVRVPWLVKPGFHAVEVYEKMILATCNEQVTLKPCIGQAAVLSYGYQVKDKEGKSWMVGNNGQTRHVGYRDICYVMLTPEHSQHITCFFESHHFRCHVSVSTMTPSGMLSYATPPESNHTLDFAPFIEGLRARRPHLRSQLPAGVPMFPTYGDNDSSFNDWAIPLAPRKLDPSIEHYSRVEQHDGFTRVEWPIPYDPVLLRASKLGPAVRGNATNFVDNTRKFQEELMREIKTEDMGEHPEDNTGQVASQEERDFLDIFRMLDNYRRQLSQSGHAEASLLEMQREVALMRDALLKRQSIVERQMDAVSIRYRRCRDMKREVDYLFNLIRWRREKTQ